MNIMSLIPGWSNLVHKYNMETALFNQLKAGFKEANRHRIPFTIQANNTAVVEYVAPFSGIVEGIIVASPTAATVSTSGNSVTITVIDKNGAVTVASFDTFINKTELAQNTGAAFFNLGPAMSNGGQVPAFQGGDVLTVTVTVNGTPGISTSNSVNCLLTLVPSDPKVAF